MPQLVATFLRHSLLLKAAMADCAVNPKPKPVHKLRSTTRRMEAVLELLATSADLPHARKQEKPVRKYLRKLRRAASKVRDLDVHLEILASYKTFDDAAVLEKDLKAARERSVRKLQRRLLKDTDDLQQALDNLEVILAPVVDLDLSGEQLIQAAQSWLAKAVRGLNPQRDNALHAIRKACKTTRYIAEIGSETSQAAAAFAKRLDDIQQATGAWHDFLLLLGEARALLPKDSPLVEKIQAKSLQLRRKAESKAAHLSILSKPASTRAK